MGVTPRTIYRWEAGKTRPNQLAMRTLKAIVSGIRIPHRMKPDSFTFIDLFAGIGGLRLAFEAAGGKCVFTSEWDKACRTTYAANFPDGHNIEGDIREVDPDDIPGHDVLVAGFPCQPFSIAGVSKKNALGRPHGFRCDTQGTLFFDLARIIESHRPAAFLLENVRNLQNHNGGTTFSVIRRTLEEELGYDVHYRVINAKGWVPQNRERIFIAGFREPCDFSFDDMKVPDPADGPRLQSILERNTDVLDKYTLTPRLWEYLQNYKLKHRAKGNGFGFSLFGPKDVARTLSARYYKDGSEILIRQRGKRPRRLTPRECARLMGFDRPGRPEFRIPVSDTQAYKQFGNAVVVQSAEAVARHMQPFILNAGSATYDQPDLFETDIHIDG